MARSNAEKKRRKLEREGFRNPEKSRITNEKMADISLHVRVTGGKDEYSRKVKHKKHVRNQNDGDAFYIVYEAKFASQTKHFERIRKVSSLNSIE